MPEFQVDEKQRRPTTPAKKKIKNVKKSFHLVGNYIRTRAAVAREAAEKKVVQTSRDPPRTRLAVKEGKQKVEPVNIDSNCKKVSSFDIKIKKVSSKVPVILITSKERESEKMLGDDSGGISANNKATGQDDDGNKSPFPERVILVFEFCVNFGIYVEVIV